MYIDGIDGTIEGLSLTDPGGGKPGSRRLEEENKNANEEQGTICQAHDLSHETTMTSSASVGPSLCLPLPLTELPGSPWHLLRSLMCPRLHPEFFLLLDYVLSSLFTWTYCFTSESGLGLREPLAIGVFFISIPTESSPEHSSNQRD